MDEKTTQILFGSKWTPEQYARILIPVARMGGGLTGLISLALLVPGIFQRDLDTALVGFMGFTGGIVMAISPPLTPTIEGRLDHYYPAAQRKFQQVVRGELLRVWKLAAIFGIAPIIIGTILILNNIELPLLFPAFAFYLAFLWLAYQTRRLERRMNDDTCWHEAIHLPDPLDQQRFSTFDEHTIDKNLQMVAQMALPMFSLGICIVVLSLMMGVLSLLFSEMVIASILALFLTYLITAWMFMALFKYIDRNIIKLNFGLKVILILLGIFPLISLLLTTLFVLLIAFIELIEYLS